MTGEITRDIIREQILDTPLGEFKGADFELALDYYLDDKKGKEVENLYKKVIAENAERFFQELQNFKKDKEIDVKYEISNLVSFLSLASLNEKDILTESPILKTLRAIPSIENVFVLYTKDSEKRFEELKEYLHSMNKEVSGKSVDIENINESYDYLQSLVKAGEIDGENTIMDSTLGLRMFGIALYKIAVERGMNIITWRDYQLPAYFKFGDIYTELDGKTKRIPFLTKLTLMQEPKFENAKIYRALIEDLKKFNFSGASSYYNTLGLGDLKKFCEDLDEVFNLKNVLELDCERFYLVLESRLEKILNYDLEEEKSRELIKPIILKLLSLVDYKRVIKGINDFNIKEADVDDYIEKLLKTDKNIKVRIYYLFVLKYLEIKLGEEAIDSTIVKNIVKKISKWNKEKKELDFESVEEVLEALFDVYDVEKLSYSDIENLSEKYKSLRDKKIKIKRKITDIFEIAEDLVDDVEYPIEWNGSTLKIAKYNLNIDFFAEERSRGVNYIFTSESTVEKIKCAAIANPIIALFTNSTEKLDEWKIEEIYNEKKKKGANTLSKNKSNLRNIVKFINEVINLKLKELGKEEREFIVIENKSEDANKSKKSIKRIYIDEFFQNMREQ